MSNIEMNSKIEALRELEELIEVAKAEAVLNGTTSAFFRYPPPDGKLYSVDHSQQNRLLD